MQVLKGHIKEKIMETGKKEFLEKGFQRTSMKNIAEGAGIQAPTIYCYFKNKEDLFLTLVKPVTSYFEEKNAEMEKIDPRELARTWEYEQRKSEYSKHMQFIGKHRQEFRLLFSSAGGSSLEYYFDRLVEQYEELMRKILLVLKEAKIMETPVSDFFIHNMAAFYVTTLREASLNEIPEAMMEVFADEWALFRTWGWRGITKNINMKGSV